MRSNSGLERLHRSSVSQRSLSATSFRTDIGVTELLMPRGPGASASRRRDWVGRHGLVVIFGAWPASLQARARPVSQPSAACILVIIGR